MFQVRTAVITLIFAMSVSFFFQSCFFFKVVFFSKFFFKMFPFCNVFLVLETVYKKFNLQDMMADVLSPPD